MPNPLPAHVPHFEATLPFAATDPGSTHPPAPSGTDSLETMPPSSPSSSRSGDGLAPPGYEILGELGRGGMGVVYKAKQIKAGRLVALKMMLSGGHADDAERQRFRTEGEAVARLQHPGIVQVFEVGEHDGRAFFSLEFCPGGSLDRKLAGTPLLPGQAAALVQQLARAMQLAHDAQVLHRDLKPANILLTAEGTAKITDFGLAKKLDETGQTATGSVMGTPSYMSPEQAEGRKGIGPRADVYSLGAILYECLTGRPPFKAATVLDTIRQAVSEEPVGVRRLNPKVPSDLETIALKCLQKQPERRYRDAAALAEDLRRFLAGEAIAARPVGGAERAWRWCRRNPVVAGLVAAVFAVLVTGATISGILAVRANEAAGRAEESAARAEADEKRAVAAAARAEENEGRAIAEKDNADHQRKSAVEEKGRADAQRDRAERVLYAAQIKQAKQYWEDGHVAAARATLEDCQWDLRGWEHAYLHTLFDHLGQKTVGSHASGVNGVAFSPDGRRVASASDDGTVKVWDAHMGRELLSLSGGEKGVIALAYSADGGRIVSGGQGGAVRVWDAVTGRQLLSLKGHTHWVWGVAFSPDGGRVASGSQDGTVKVWDARTGRGLLSLKGHAPRVTGVAFSPDGERLASCGWDGTVKVRDSRTGAELLSLKGHTANVTGVAFSPDGGRLASASQDNTVKVWDTHRGRELLTLRGHRGWVSGVAFGPDGARVASASWDGTVRVWDTETGGEVLSLRGHAGLVCGVAISPDGRRIASGSTGSYDNTVKVWDAERGGGLLSLKGHAKAVSGVAFSPSGGRIASGSYDKAVKVWDTEKGRELFSLRGHTGSVLAVAFSPDGGRIASGDNDKTVKLWDAHKGRELLSLRGHVMGVSGVAFSPDGRRLASGSYDKTVKLWDAQTGQEMLSLGGHTGQVTGVTFSFDGRRVAAASDNGTVKLWDARNGQELLSLKGHSGGINAVSFSSNGRRIASAGRDRTVKVWDVEKGGELLSLKGHTNWVWSLAFSPDGRRLVSASWDGTLKVWDTEKGHELLSLKGNAAGFASVAFSPDGSRLASGGFDNAVEVWDAGKSQEILSLKGHTSEIESVAFSPDSKRILAKDTVGMSLVWDGRTGNLSSEAAPAFPAKQKRARHGGREAWADGAIVRVRHSNNDPARSRDLSVRGDALSGHLERSIDCERRKQWFALAFHLRRLASLDPTNATHPQGLGNALAELGRWREADAAFDLAIRRGASGPWLRYYRALIRLAQNESVSLGPIADDMMASSVAGQTGPALMALPSTSAADPFRLALACRLGASPPTDTANLPGAALWLAGLFPADGTESPALRLASAIAPGSTRGPWLYRVGRLREARAALQAVGGTGWPDICLALVDQADGKADAARDRLIRGTFALDAPSIADPRRSQLETWPWVTRLLMARWRREAESKIGLLASAPAKMDRVPPGR